MTALASDSLARADTVATSIASADPTLTALVVLVVICTFVLLALLTRNMLTGKTIPEMLQPKPTTRRRAAAASTRRRSGPARNHK